MQIAAFPPEGATVTAIFTLVIGRLAEEFNQKLVETVLTLLASARRGLSERELQELVACLDSADDLFPVLRQLRPYRRTARFCGPCGCWKRRFSGIFILLPAVPATIRKDCSSGCGTVHGGMTVPRWPRN